MKVDFSKVTVKDIDGNDNIFDLSKDLGKMMYENSFLDEELQLGKEIYQNGEVELNKIRAEAIKKYLPNFKAFVRIPLAELLNSSDTIDSPLEDTNLSNN